MTRRSDEIAGIAAAARTRLDARHRAREATIGAARAAIQASAASIRATHRGEFDNARVLADEARAHLEGANLATETTPDVRSGGPLGDAKKEFTEAELTLAFVRGDPLPTPEQLGVDPAPYLNGMAEAASELRRQTLDCMRRGELERAETLLGAMDDVYSMLVTIDYPDAVTGGLRRTTDALRAVLERTRGDVTTTTIAARLQASIDAERSRRDGG